MSDKCISCGEYVLEGWQVCLNCSIDYRELTKTDIDRQQKIQMKNMNKKRYFTRYVRKAHSFSCGSIRNAEMEKIIIEIKNERKKISIFNVINKAFEEMTKNQWATDVESIDKTIQKYWNLIDELFECKYEKHSNLLFEYHEKQKKHKNQPENTELLDKLREELNTSLTEIDKLIEKARDFEKDLDALL